MARWWTKPPVIIAVLGVLVVILSTLFPRTTITQHTSGAGSPAIGSAGGDVTITQQPVPSPTVQSPATPPAQPSLPVTPTPPTQPWWQQPPVIAGIITAIATLVAALIQWARATSPAKPQTPRPRRTS